MLERAATLFKANYRIEPFLLGVFRVWRPGLADSYLVDMERRTCECVCFQQGRYQDTTGRTTCKHLLGLRGLLLAQAQSYAQRFVRAKRPLSERLDAASWECYALYDWLSGGEMYVPDRFIGLIREDETR